MAHAELPQLRTLYEFDQRYIADNIEDGDGDSKCNVLSNKAITLQC